MSPDRRRRRRRRLAVEVLALVVGPLVVIQVAAGSAAQRTAPSAGVPAPPGAGGVVGGGGAGSGGAASVGGSAADGGGAGVLGTAGLPAAGAAPLPATAPGPAGTVPWSLASSAQPQVPTAALAGDWCAGPGTCVAVGAYDDPAGDGVALVESMVGRSWRLVPTPGVPGADYSYLAAVSCVSTAACVAVGASTDGAGVSVPLVESWDGSRWRIEPVVLPGGAAYGALDAVSCPVVGACVAVGSYSSAAGTGLGLVEDRSGTAWGPRPVPAPAGSAYSSLSSVSCVEPGRCEAVGASTSVSGRQSSLAEALAGGRWSIDPTSAAAGTSAGLLSAVSCSSGGVCSAVGDERTAAGVTVPLVEASVGGRWVIEPSGLGAAQRSGFLAALDCAGPGRCTAVGYGEDPAGVDTPLAEQSAEGRWSVEPVRDGDVGAVAGTDEEQLGAVACPTAASCVGVGYATPSSGVQQPLAALDSAGRWTPTTPAVPTGASAGLLGAVSCAAGSCEAVGYGVSAGGRRVTLAEVRRGRTWVIEPTPATGSASALYGVSCRPPGTCTAVGYATTPAGAEVPVADERDGGRWRSIAAPLPASATRAALYGVSCAPASCVAVGDLTDGAGVDRPLAETWDGRQWAVVVVPEAPGTASAALYGVSCTGRSCVAVGVAVDAAGRRVAVVDTEVGGRWQPVELPTPDGATGSQLDAVSCPGSGFCEAVGSVVDASGVEGTLVEGLQAGRWRVQPSPDPLGAAGRGLDGLVCSAASACTTLYSVSCALPGSCRAVGAYETSAGAQAAFSETLAAAAWRVVATPAPPGAGASDLYGVSCSPGATCAAAGSSVRRSDIETTLVVTDP